MDAALRIGVVVLVLVFVVLAASVAAVVFEPDPPVSRSLPGSRAVESSASAGKRSELRLGLEEPQAGDATGDLDAKARHVAVRLRLRRGVVGGKVVEAWATGVGGGHAPPRRTTHFPTVPLV